MRSVCAGRIEHAETLSSCTSDQHLTTTSHTWPVRPSSRPHSPHSLCTLSDHTPPQTPRTRRVTLGVVVWHLVSVLALTALMVGRVMALDDQPSTSDQRSTNHDRSRSSSNGESFNDWLLKVSSSSRFIQDQQCLRLDSHRVNELCRMPPNNRIKRLRRVYFDVSQGLGGSNSSSSRSGSGLPQLPGLTMYELFLLELCNVTNMEDFTAMYNLETLQYNASKCVYSPIYEDCVDCFDQLLVDLDRLETEVAAFSHILAQYSECVRDPTHSDEHNVNSILHLDVNQRNQEDYEHFVDENFAFDTFSSMSDCENCRKGYLLWLLVEHMSSMWNRTLCANWCLIAELTCPHIRTTLKTDYAGFPLFRCHDPEISSTWSERNGNDITAFEQTPNTDCRCVDACQFHQYLMQVFVGGPEDQYLPAHVLSPYGAVHDILLQCNDYKTRCPSGVPIAPQNSHHSRTRPPVLLLSTIMLLLAIFSTN